MANPPTNVRVRPVDRGALPELYDIAAGALTLDRFSAELLAEKLFENPRPGREEYAVYLAEVEHRPVGMMQSIVRRGDARAWMGVFAVSAAYRRQGVASRLFETVSSEWAAAGVESAEAMAVPGNYLLPGIDPRYTEALCLLERHGFERFKDCANMVADLHKEFDTGPDEERLAGLGIDVKRAGPSDHALLKEFFDRDFGEDWLVEADLAMRNDPPALHIALKNGHIIAFSAHSGQNREWGFFGPMGTTPASRGTGVGRVLLWHCLNDLRRAGHRTSLIPWVGPIGFYSRYVSARVTRVFWRYRLDLRRGASENPPSARG